MKHWLARIASQASDIHPKATIEEAWNVVAGACGISETDLARRVAAHFRLGLADLTAIPQSALDLIPERVVRQFQVVGLRDDKHRIIVATSDPTNLLAEQAIAFASSRTVVFEIAAPSQLRAFIGAKYAPDTIAENIVSRTRSELADAVHFVTRGTDPEIISLQEAEKPPVVRLTNLIIHDAIQAGASDIHVEPDLKDGVVRTRVDGVLGSYMQVPRQVLDRVVSRIKVMGNMDISDRLRPQSGRAHVQVAGVDYDLRISTVPTRQSEKAVVRILGPGRVHSLNDIGVTESDVQRMRQLFSNRDGILVVTGPTGSGKTTTLYAAIQEVARGHINIMTVEDPVEYELSGLTQIQIAPRQGLTFAAALRTVLRQDPDIILVGEIRDLETAEIAVQASQTGHLVLTTLHTNDTVSVLARLAGLGINRANIASALRGVVAQRLLRRLCNECRERVDPMTPAEKELAGFYGIVPAFRARGCKQCSGTGYRGRIPVVEILVNTPQVEQLIASGKSAQEIRKQAEQFGMLSLTAAGLLRVQNGETTMDEVQRVLGIGSVPEKTRPEHADINVESEISTLIERDQPSIAILPFADLSPAQDQKYLCDGLAEELTHALSRFSGLRVVPRTSALRSGKELGVDSVLEGSIQRSGSRLRISVRLVNVEDGCELMSERYESDLKDVFDLEDEITRKVSEQLRVILFGNPPPAPRAPVPTVDPEAHDLYLKGRFEWNRRNEDGLQRSIDFFKQAIAHDPNYAAVHAGMASAYVTLAIYGVIAPDTAMPKAVQAADRALTLDARSAEALTARSCVRTMYFWDWSCEDGFQQAIELEPNNPTAHHWYAVHYLMPLRRFDEARRALNRAVQLDPHSMAISASLGILSYFECEYDDAVAQHRRTLAADPGFGIGHYFLGLALAERGQYNEALLELQRARVLTGDSPEVLSAIGYTHARAGQSEWAREALDRLGRMAAERYVSPVLFAQIAAGLGDRDAAFTYLVKASELRATELVWLAVRPTFENLHADSRFELSSRVLPSTLTSNTSIGSDMPLSA